MASKRKLKKRPETKLKRQKKLNEHTMKKSNLTTLDELLDREYGPRGAKKREKFEAGFEAFKLGVLIQQAREEKGLTQEQVAALAGTNKSYISKLEKDLKDVRFSTLRRIVTEGLGGKLEIAIRF
jgi:HTH-type transcriptional regulator / antitoxin HipB